MKVLLTSAASAAVASAIFSAVPTSAATTVYTSEAAFRAAVTGATDYTFPFTSTSAIGNSYTRGPVTFSSTNQLFAYPSSGNPGNGTATSPYLEAGSNLTINSPLSAVGFLLSISGYVDTVSYAFGAASGSIVPPNAPQITFLGFINTTGNVSGDFNFNGVLLNTTRFVTGTAGATSAVPEPASWAMMILGMGAVGFAMRRSRKSKVNKTVSLA